MKAPHEVANSIITSAMSEIESVREDDARIKLDSRIYMETGGDGNIDREYRHRIRKAMTLRKIIAALIEQADRLENQRQ